ncbi:MAG TPA: 30S ribosomal protein S16 [Acidimicrobiia bacterium]|nr:30S ribosomal protein S16 [Acidimicrobiia bacterium]
MAVKIRLTRIGKKAQPSYRVVVADARGPRDGRYIEQIGRYDPRQEPSVVEIDNERASYWISQGAQPSSQVKKLLEISGAMKARPVKDSEVHVVGELAETEAATGDAGVIAATAAVGEVFDRAQDVVADTEDAAGDAAGTEAVVEEEA